MSIQHRKTTSLSSVSSDESTRDLIESLESETKRKEREEAYNKLEAGADKTLEPKTSNTPPATQNEVVTGGTAATIITPATSPIISTETILPPSKVINNQPLPNNNKKPIKFTVRKVSHESPDPNLYANGSIDGGGRKVSGSESNSIATNESISQVQKNVAHTQEKYDQYSKKIEKINKEIEFLQNLLPPYNVEIDYATRTKITNAVEKLKMKQDELEKKKYSLGITISRLWRSMDDNDIWVRSMGKQ